MCNKQVLNQESAKSSLYAFISPPLLQTTLLVEFMQHLQIIILLRIKKYHPVRPS